MPAASVHPCASTPGTEILTGRIPVGSQDGDSARGLTSGGTTSTNRGEEGGSNAALEGLAG
ncbi:hypothetical protein GCM10010129_19160 [Streptomyces fumigatiscleroticus]|nr:hypothetical protein GCM10010129_19160 [Streptomyces fumigatiscleroticus]